ncbi:uncharacterized protein [Montipora foliosa]|uniref:uncharacterized protein n=1 Tax=Montipora foliosa TaxID=591990 RepID=UPI0035F17429
MLDSQSDKSTTGSVSVWTQTAFEQMSHSLRHERFSRKEEEVLCKEELGHVKGTKVICLLDLPLQQLARPCKYPGCIHMATLEYSLCSTYWTVLYVRRCKWLPVPKDKWLSLVHHVCNEHEWITRRCDYEEMA